MKNSYDLIVVGAGPAGLTAAKVAAENGLSVALLERKDTIHEILRMCGMMIVTLSGKYMGERVVYNQDASLISFPHNGFSLKYEGPTKNFYAWNIYSPNGEKIVFGDYDTNEKKGDDGRASAVYSKSRLLEGLVEECRRLGTDIYPGENVIDVSKNGESVEVQTASGKHFQAMYVIAADGRQSRVARVMGMNRNRGFWGSVTSVGYEMTNLDLPQPYALHQPLIRSGNPPMLGFVVPRAWDHEGEDVWLVMITNVDMQADHEQLFEDMTQRSRYASWFKNGRKIRRCGCTGNMYSPLFHPCKDNVLFVGDAGWCQEAEMTGAVMSGWKAASAVVVAMMEGSYTEEAVQPYMEWWQHYHIQPLDYKVFLRNLYMPILCNDNEIDYIFSKINDTLPTVLDPYEVPDNMGRAMTKIIPQIQQERPDLLSKLSGFSSLPPEVVLRTTIRGGFNCSFTT